MNSLSVPQQAQGFTGTQGEARRNLPVGQRPAINEKEVHYTLGGMRHATGQYNRDIQRLNRSIDMDERKQTENAKSAVKPLFQTRPSNYKRVFYQTPRISHLTRGIKIKT